ncbi:MAG: ACT domain-containing protein [Candidatus Marinimicrobia bacterium]|nr:ACT domain-containing protein [Candidatus Neomarinimicrobiota bacterium]
MSRAGESDLHALLANLEPEMQEGVFVFVTDTDAENLPAKIDPILQFRENEGTTLILPRDVAEASALEYSYPCRHIILTVHSDLNAVGLLARTTAVLADAGISVNVVSGYYHDHLFVPVETADEALKALASLQ